MASINITTTIIMRVSLWNRMIKTSRKVETLEIFLRMVSKTTLRGFHT